MADRPIARLQPRVDAPRDELRRRGRLYRKIVPRSAHAVWQPPPDRRDPVEILEENNRHRVPDLIPVRYARMLESPFTFLRGAPAVMAHDLAAGPATGIHVQACGDAHLLNFGLFASPERTLVFDVNDFDETLPGPWEWDVKRLAASVAVATRAALPKSDPGAMAVRAVAGYRSTLAHLAELTDLEAWYLEIRADDLAALVTGPDRAAVDQGLERARRHDSFQAQEQLTEVVDGERRLIEDPPFLVHIDDAELHHRLTRLTSRYFASLQDDRQHLLQKFRVADLARKVVGVGSVGTRCWVALLTAYSDDAPLFLQLKEAVPSVLEPHVGRSEFANHGQRVVNGQRLMQAASDVFLGWTRLGYDFYIRQLRDMKGSARLDRMNDTLLREYAGLCGATLARAHARSMAPALLSGYLGTSEVFDQAIGSWAIAYAEQTERDYQRLTEAAAAGRIEVAPRAR